MRGKRKIWGGNPRYELLDMFWSIQNPENDDIHIAWNLPNDVEKLLESLKIRTWKAYMKSFHEQLFILPKEKEYKEMLQNEEKSSI